MTRRIVAKSRLTAKRRAGHLGEAMVRVLQEGVDAILRAATLRKLHASTHSRQSFVGVNITRMLNLLEEAATAGVRSFISAITPFAPDALFELRENAPLAVKRSFPDYEEGHMRRG